MSKVVDDNHRADVARGWAGSGMSQADYAFFHGISSRTLRSWVRRYTPAPERADRQAFTIIDKAIAELTAIREALVARGETGEAAGPATATTHTASCAETTVGRVEAITEAVEPTTGGAATAGARDAPHPLPAGIPPASNSIQAKALSAGLPPAAEPENAPLEVVSAGIPPAEERVAAPEVAAAGTPPVSEQATALPEVVAAAGLPAGQPEGGTGRGRRGRVYWTH
ncbi:MAG: helix-turn-helix domain-containing protein [Myxococcaceae bacterium]